MGPARARDPRPVEVHVPVQTIARFRDLVDGATHDGWCAAVEEAAGALRGRVLWQVSSTARGGGVAEMLASQVGLARDAGIDARWMVIAGTPEFFAITKRLHNRLHACDGDGSAGTCGAPPL